MDTLACLTVTVFLLSSFCQKSCAEVSFSSSEPSPSTFDSTESSPPTFDSTESSPLTFDSTKSSPLTFNATKSSPPTFNSKEPSSLTTGYHFMTPDQCPHPEFCSEAAQCCQLGVDEFGWIAAAVGWSLWFLTLIILCIDKLTKLKPDEPKYMEA